MRSVRFLKGHGTENDFVLVPDLDGALELTPDLVRSLCDRRAGIGADGVLRIVPTALVADEPAVRSAADQAGWFMDYRNADGSVSEMCGNGVRVFALFLVQEGLVLTGRTPGGALTSSFPVATRAGVRHVDLQPDGRLSVTMGPATHLRDSVDVTMPGPSGGPATTWPGSQVSMGNPHVVVELDEPEGVNALAGLTAQGEALPAPVLSPAPAHGANVEFVVRRGPDHIAMRVHERGVGETRSCGTGACAAAAAVSPRNGEWSCVVDVPGGRLGVSRDLDGMIRLVGPAVILGEGVLRDDWVALHA